MTSFYLRTTIFGLLALLSGTVQARQPNFIIIYCDDLGYSDIGPFGSTQHRTPHLDGMAREGMRLTNFYSTCGVCTPARSSLMTGCYPQRVGLHESEKGQWVLFPGNRRGLNSSETTIAEVLQQAGYATAIVGKWHLGDQPPFLPTRHGFDSYFGIPFSNDMGKMDRPIKMYPPIPLLRNERVIELEPDQRYLTQRYTAEALSFIESHQEEPFFLYLPHSMPHWPQYSSAAFADQSNNKAWGDAVEEIDWSTGQILAKLRELDIDEDTLIVFTSDNGGATNRGASNAPLRGGKGSTWEGGHRVCCVARWPGQIPAGSENSALTVSFDLLPTLAKLAGIENPRLPHPIDGKDIRDVLTNTTQQSPHEAYFYYFKGELNAVRSGAWKLFTKRRPTRNQPAILPQPELYNLAEDIGEQRDVATQHPEIVARLRTLLDEMRDKLGDGADAPGSEQRPAGHVADAVTLTSDAPNALRETEVFVAGQDGFHTFRIPALVTTPSGSLLAICEGRKNNRKDHGDVDLVMKRSEDLGRTWSSLQTIHEEGGNQEITIGNPCPVVDRTTGTIWLPFCRDNDDVLITFSTDDGRTWAPPKDITSQVKAPGWSWYATGPGLGIQLTRKAYRGRLVIPCDHRQQIDGRSVTMSHVFYSDDHGQSWQLGGSVDHHTNECQVVELHDGKLMVNMRNVWGRDGGKEQLGGQRAVAMSLDGGSSWEPTSFDATLVEPICQASFIKHSDDTFRRPPLLFSNPASKTKRHRLTVRVSDDDGATWKDARIIHDGPSAYSCLSVLPDRSIGCLYEGGEGNSYEKVIFAQFTLPWIKQE